MAVPQTTTTDLTIIGAGIAGMAAALFAANRGISTVQVGSSGGIIFASGLLDLMGVYPVGDKKIWQDPWAAVDALVRAEPKHPYARLKKESIRLAFAELLEFLQEAGLSYRGNDRHNVEVITALGTVKPTYRVPETMWSGVQALEKKTPCLLADFHGLKEYSASQIAATLQARWPRLKAVRLFFPGMDNRAELYPYRMAQALELSETRTKLAQAVRVHVKDAQAVGLPAILGLHRTRKILDELTDRIGVAVFEIPMMPTSVPGLRLKETFEAKLPLRGIRQFPQHLVLEARPSAGGGFILGIGHQMIEHHIQTEGVILATGRFLGKGLYAERKRIREAVFDLPVCQPESRSSWHQQDFLDPRGHAANRAGLEIDDCFRPLDTGGRPAFGTLYAAGSILAHQDWMRMKCGAGIAIATAYGAVKAFLQQKKDS